jgi:hypothetical protein
MGRNRKTGKAMVTSPAMEEAIQHLLVTEADIAWATSLPAPVGRPGKGLRERCRHTIRQLHQRIAALEKENAALRAELALLRGKRGGRNSAR